MEYRILVSQRIETGVIARGLPSPTHWDPPSLQHVLGIGWDFQIHGLARTISTASLRTKPANIISSRSSGRARWPEHRRDRADGHCHRDAPARFFGEARMVSNAVHGSASAWRWYSSSTCMRYAAVAFSCFRISRIYHGKGDEPSAVFRPALQDRDLLGFTSPENDLLTGRSVRVKTLIGGARRVRQASGGARVVARRWILIPFPAPNRGAGWKAGVDGTGVVKPHVFEQRRGAVVLRRAVGPFGDLQIAAHRRPSRAAAPVLFQRADKIPQILVGHARPPRFRNTP